MPYQDPPYRGNNKFSTTVPGRATGGRVGREASQEGELTGRAWLVLQTFGGMMLLNLTATQMDIAVSPAQEIQVGIVTPGASRFLEQAGRADPEITLRARPMYPSSSPAPWMVSVQAPDPMMHPLVAAAIEACGAAAVIEMARGTQTTFSGGNVRTYTSTIITDSTEQPGYYPDIAWETQPPSKKPAPKKPSKQPSKKRAKPVDLDVDLPIYTERAIELAPPADPPPEKKRK